MNFNMRVAATPVRTGQGASARASSRKPTLRLASLLLLLLPTMVEAQDWGAIANVSTTMGINANRICVGEASRGDIGCPTYAPSMTTAGDISVTGNLSAAKFYGDGSALTGVNTSVSVTTGLSGSLVFRDEYGSLQARSSLSISSTTGSLGIGAGAPASLGNNGLYVAGSARTAGYATFDSDIYIGGNKTLLWNSLPVINAEQTSQYYLRFLTSNSEAMRIVSTGSIGIGTTDPSSTLHISGTLTIANPGSLEFKYASPSFVGGSIKQPGSGRLGLYLGNTNIVEARQSGLFFTKQYFLDGYDNPLFMVRTNASGSNAAASHLTVTGGDSSPTLSVSGTDTNIDLTLRAKGTGNVALNPTSNLSGLSVSATGPSAANVGIILKNTNANSQTFGIFATGNGHNSGVGKLIFTPATGGNNYLAIDGNTSRVGIMNPNPSTTLHVSGTLRIADGLEACDTDRLGAIKYAAGTFSVCKNTTTGWEALTTGTAGVTTFASLTDVSISTAAGNIFNTGTLTGATSAVTNTTAFGVQALNSASNSGSRNAAFGYQALRNNTSGEQNTATGYGALGSNTTGGHNTAFGSEAMSSNQTGGTNSAFGRTAMQSNQSGNRNTAIGHTALRTGTTASQNTALGYASLYYATGANNVGLGDSAGYHAIGSSNTLVGAFAGQGVSNTSTFGNTVAVGYRAGASLTSGGNNTLLGYQAGGAITTGNNNLVIGFNISPFSNTGNNQLNLGNALFGDLGDAANLNAKLGINITSPTASLEVSGTISTTALTVNGVAITGSASTSPTITTGLSGSIVFRDQSGYLNAYNTFSISSTTGSVGIGAGAPASLSNNSLYAVGNLSGANVFATGGSFYAQPSQGLHWSNANNAIIGNPNTTAQYITFTTSGTEALRIVSTGYVGIGTNAPIAALEISATASGTAIPTVVIRGTSYAVQQFMTGNSNTVRSSIRADGAGNLVISPNGGGLIFGQDNSGANSYAFKNSGGDVFRITSGGQALVNGLTASTPSATFHVIGSLRIGTETSTTLATCDTDRLGALKYTSGAFYVCQSVSNGWEALGTTGANANNDRIISGTTQAIAYSNTSLSLVTAGTERVVIGTNGNVGIGQQPASDVALGLSGTALITSNAEIRGIVSTSAVQLAENPGQSCNPGTYGTIKIVGGRLFVCKQTP